MLRRFLNSCLWRAAIALVATCTSGVECFADEWIELAIPLRDGRFYSLHDFYTECNRKLGTAYSLERVADRQLELTGLDRAGLLLAGEAGLIRSQIDKDQLLLFVPNREDERTRLRNRQRLERLLGIPLTLWPPDKGLHLPEKFDPAARTLLLIHRFESGSETFGRFQQACQHWGIQVVIFDYPSRGPLAWAGDRLSADLKALVAKYPRVRLAVVGHSAGGLVARYCLETPGKEPQCVTDLFTLGTPHAGTELASEHEWLELAYTLVPSARAGSRTLQDGLGEGSDDVRPGSAFLQALNARHRAAGVRYHSVIGRKSFLSDDQRTVVERELREFFDRRGTSDEAREQVFKVLQSEAFQTGRGDGVVSVRSAGLDGITSQMAFDLNHLELLSLPGDQPEDCEVFRWILEKLHWKRM